MDSKDTTPVTLLTIPAELRLEIYKHLLVSYNPIGFYLDMQQRLPADDDEHDTLHVRVLRVCRQIHDEAAPVLYRHNVFQLGQEWTYDGTRLYDAAFFLGKFFGLVGARNSRFVERVRIWLDQYDPTSAPVSLVCAATAFLDYLYESNLDIKYVKISKLGLAYETPERSKGVSAGQHSSPPDHGYLEDCLTAGDDEAESVVLLRDREGARWTAAVVWPKEEGEEEGNDGN